MSNRTAAVGIALIVGAALFVRLFVMVVSEYEQVVLTEFGQTVGEARTEPGIYLVMPWYAQHRFSKRLLRWDGDRSQIPTRDKRFIWVDAAARWRITDPLKFLQSVNNYSSAQTRLDDIIDSVVRQTISENDLIEVVRSDSGEEGQFEVNVGRRELQEKMLSRSRELAREEYGIELVDVRIKRINYIAEVQANIFNRMIAERRKVAEQYRSEGKGRAAEILGQMERQLEEIRSAAYRKAREIEGQADAAAAAIYAAAYSQDAEFYAFLQSLETFEKALGGGDRTRLVLSTESDLLRYLQRAR